MSSPNPSLQPIKMYQALHNWPATCEPASPCSDHLLLILVGEMPNSSRLAQPSVMMSWKNPLDSLSHKFPNSQALNAVKMVPSPFHRGLRTNHRHGRRTPEDRGLKGASHGGFWGSTIH